MRRFGIGLVVMVVGIVLASIGGFVSKNNDSAPRQGAKGAKSITRLPIVSSRSGAEAVGVAMPESVRNRWYSGTLKSMPLPATKAQPGTREFAEGVLSGAKLPPPRVDTQTSRSTKATVNQIAGAPTNMGGGIDWNMVDQTGLTGSNVDQVFIPGSMPTYSAIEMVLSGAGGTRQMNASPRVGIVRGATDTHAFVTSWVAAGATGNCEKSGTSTYTCSVPYPIKPGQTTWLRAWRLTDTQDGAWWGFWAIDHVTNKETRIGSLYFKRNPGTSVTASPSLFNIARTGVAGYTSASCTTPQQHRFMNPALDYRKKFVGYWLYPNYWKSFPSCSDGRIVGSVSVDPQGYYTLKVPASRT